jgi:hypothetical protein
MKVSSQNTKPLIGVGIPTPIGLPSYSNTIVAIVHLLSTRPRAIDVI